MQTFLRLFSINKKKPLLLLPGPISSLMGPETLRLPLQSRRRSVIKRPLLIRPLITSA